ncbi:MAG: CotH kinase family protein [Cyclobacteriaceae bacterium]
MKAYWFLIFTFPLLAYSQILSVEESEVYDDSILPRIDITIDQADLDFILASENRESDQEFTATFQFSSLNFNALEENIGFRLRGNTSRQSAKKSFKVSFNSFEKGRDLKGFEKINLNGEHNDPTIARAKLCWDLMNSLHVPASRTNHVELYINNAYYGLYINVEHIDEEFVELRFGNKDGNLYKCLWPADLKYKGDSPDAYKEEHSGRRTYELKTNESEDDYSGLAKFIKVLNQTSSSLFEEEIEKVFDVNSYLRALAVEVLVAHWDNYGINQNNFYLYDNPTDGKFYYIPYDLDNTLGVDFFDVDWADWNIYSWYNDDRPLTKRILAVEKYREEFTRVMDRLLREEFLPSKLNPRIDELKALIQDAAERDEFRTYDYGFSISDFNKSFETRLDQFHVRYGLKEYIARRHETALSQLDEVIPLSTRTKTPQFNIFPNPAYETFEIQFENPSATNHLYIYTMDGKMVWTETYSENNIRVDHKLSPGTYIIGTQAEGVSDYQSTKKLIISR